MEHLTNLGKPPGLEKRTTLRRVRGFRGGGPGLLARARSVRCRRPAVHEASICAARNHGWHGVQEPKQRSVVMLGLKLEKWDQMRCHVSSSRGFYHGFYPTLKWDCCTTEVYHGIFYRFRTFRREINCRRFSHASTGPGLLRSRVLRRRIESLGCPQEESL